MTPSTGGTATEQDGTITEEMVENMVTKMTETKVLAPNPKLQHGKRVIGPRKMKLLMKIQTECAKLGRQGINASYCLHKFTDWKGPIKTNTKKMAGIIGQGLPLYYRPRLDKGLTVWGRFHQDDREIGFFDTA